MPTPDRLHPAPFIAGATTVTLIGVWLVVAPFAVGYQPEGAEWADATIIGVVSGGAVTLLGLLALLVAFGALRGEVRRRGLAPSIRPEPAQRDREVEADTADEQPHTVHTGDLDTILSSLAAALLDDVRNGQADPDPRATPAAHTTTTPAAHRRIT